MNKYLRHIYILFFLSSISIVHLKAQLYESGIHIGYNLSQFKLKENKLSDEILVREGNRYSGGTVGIQFKMSPPKDQNVSFFKIIPSILFEGSLCRCGGNIELTTTFPDGSKSFNKLTYVLYRSSYSLKFVANMKNFRFLIGPTFSNNFYSAVQVGINEKFKYAGDQFALFSVGYEFGIGQRVGRFLFSARYDGLISDFGRETTLFPTKYRYRQYKFMIHYFLFQKHKGANWGSIYGR